MELQKHKGKYKTKLLALKFKKKLVLELCFLYFVGFFFLISIIYCLNSADTYFVIYLFI